MSRQVNKNVETVSVGIPDDFPVEPYDAIHRHCREHVGLTAAKEASQEHKAAWNAVAYRFREVHDHDEAFRRAIATSSGEQYDQERELFGFFMAGLSTIETFAYGLYFLTSTFRPQDFDVSDKRRITFKHTATLFGDHFPTEPITHVLCRLRNDPVFKAWQDARNILAHRCSPGRDIIRNIGNGAYLPSANPDDVWHLDRAPLNASTTGDRRDWLASVLNDLMRNAQTFVENHIARGSLNHSTAPNPLVDPQIPTISVGEYAENELRKLGSLLTLQQFPVDVAKAYEAMKQRPLPHECPGRSEKHLSTEPGGTGVEIKLPNRVFGQSTSAGLAFRAEWDHIDDTDCGLRNASFNYFAPNNIQFSAEFVCNDCSKSEDYMLLRVIILGETNGRPWSWHAPHTQADMFKSELLKKVPHSERWQLVANVEDAEFKHNILDLKTIALVHFCD